MDRRAKILRLCRKDGKGLEIGPSFNPVAPRRDGWDVDVLDHATADELRRKYGGWAPVDVSRIEEVDYVWKGEPLDELIGARARYDWIVASHVLEHVPDLVSMLLQRAAQAGRRALPRHPGQALLLRLLPVAQLDRRRPAGLAREAHAARPGDRLRPLLARLQQGRARRVDELGRRAPALRARVLVRRGPLRPAGSRGVRRHARWQFTPASFRLVLHDLRRLGLVSLVEVASYPTKGFEFFVTLRAQPDHRADTPEARLALCERMVEEVARQARTRSFAARTLHRAAVRARDAAARLLGARRRAQPGSRATR